MTSSLVTILNRGNHGSPLRQKHSTQKHDSLPGECQLKLDSADGATVDYRPGVRHRLTSSCAVVQLHHARRAVVRTALIAAHGLSHFSEMIPAILDASDRCHRSNHVIEDAFRYVWRRDLPFCQLGREGAVQLMKHPIARCRAMLGTCPVD